MTWQDDLHQLDTRLTAKEITAVEYRKQRDEILATASSNPTARREPAPVSGGPGVSGQDPEATQVLPNPVAEWHGAQPPAQPATPLQGSEVFTRTPSSANVRRTLVVLVVLALVAAGLWWFLVSREVPVATAPPPARPGDPTAITLPGTPDERSGRMSMAEAAELGLVSQRERQLLAAAGVTEVVYVGAADTTAGLAYVVLAYPNATAKAVVEVNNALGVQDRDLTGLPEGAWAGNIAAEKSLQGRVVYASPGYVVQVGVLRSTTDDVDDLLRSVTADAVDALPVG